jgi:stage V sporulation protein B
MANALIPGTAAEVDVLVGQYTGKFVILTTLPVSLSMALAFAIIPEISSAQVQGDTGGLRDKTNTALRLSMFISMPAAVGLAVLAHPILGMLFPSHPDGGELLIIGSGVIIFLAVTHVAQGVLQGAGHVKLPVIGLLAGIAVKIGLNMLLMPRIGISGAVISSMACFAVTACANLFFLRKKCNWRPQIRTTFIKPALCAAVMGLACYATWWAVGQLTHSTIATLAALAVGFVTYIAMLMLVKSLTRQDIVGVMRNRGSRE